METTEGIREKCDEATGPIIMKSWNEMCKDATAFAKRWKNAHLFNLYANAVNREAS